MPRLTLLLIDHPLDLLDNSISLLFFFEDTLCQLEDWKIIYVSVVDGLLNLSLL